MTIQPSPTQFPPLSIIPLNNPTTKEPSKRKHTTKHFILHNHYFVESTVCVWAVGRKPITRTQPYIITRALSYNMDCVLAWLLVCFAYLLARLPASSSVCLSASRSYSSLSMYCVCVCVVNFCCSSVSLNGQQQHHFQQQRHTLAKSTTTTTTWRPRLTKLPRLSQVQSYKKNFMCCIYIFVLYCVKHKQKQEEYQNENDL